MVYYKSKAQTEFILVCFKMKESPRQILIVGEAYRKLHG